jgi:aminoglycoside phosphotransferase family enzyme
MDVSSLIELLSRPDACAPGVEAVEVRQTHVSVVLLAGAHAFKIKKPVALGFLDFTSLEKRKHFCAEEVRLNRRLAPTVYLGVVPVARDGAGLRIGGPGEVVEWAVHMERLPEEATLRARLKRGLVDAGTMKALAGKVASFHAAAERSEHISAFARWEAVAANARENFTQSRSLVGTTLDRPLFDRLEALTERWLERLRPLIESRADRGVPCDTHGDLRLDHVYLFPEREAPRDVAIVDCIEFNERFRHADPVADVAFLTMDLRCHGRCDLAEAFAAAYFRELGDEQGWALLGFYEAYRAAVRAKVEGMELGEREISAQERAAALVRARKHWLLALAGLEGLQGSEALSRSTAPRGACAARAAGPRLRRPER